MPKLEFRGRKSRNCAVQLVARELHHSPYAMIPPRNVFAILAAAMLHAGCNAGAIDGWSGSGFMDDGGVPKGDDPTGTGGPAAIVFRPDIQRDLVDEGCATCHEREGTPMQMVREPATDSEWRDNYVTVAARAGSSSASLLIDKATGAGGHGAFLSVDSAVIARWREWIAEDTAFEAGTGPADDAGTMVPPDSATPLSYVTDIAPILDSNGCLGCHGTAGDYDLSTYAAIMGPGSDSVPNVVAGDSYSVLVDYCRNGHRGIGPADAEIVLEWVVAWDARDE